LIKTNALPLHHAATLGELIDRLSKLAIYWFDICVDVPVVKVSQHNVTAVAVNQASHLGRVLFLSAEWARELINLLERQTTVHIHFARFVTVDGHLGP